IEAASAGEGRGSRFTVRLPRRPAPAVTARSTATTPADAAPPCRILIVEDNDDAREMLRMLLTLAGHQVYEAADGPGGVAMAQSVAPDLAFVDVGLPGFDGYEVARRLRAASRDKAIALVSLTGYGRPEDRQRALEAGFDTHIVKPIDPGKLMAVIASTMAAGQSHR
ncbi:MAG: response regulator, partial [Candidatus Rokuibacteriota bacterium]